MVIFVVFVVFRAEGQLQDVADASEMYLRSFFLLFLLGQEHLLSYVLSARRGVTSSFGPFLYRVLPHSSLMPRLTAYFVHVFFQDRSFLAFIATQRLEQKKWRRT